MGRTQQNRGLAAEIRKGQPYSVCMREHGENVKRAASRSMPRGADPRRGHIRDKFVVVTDDKVVRVGNTDPFFHLIEFGSINNPAYAPLRRGVLTAGLRLIAT